LDADADAGRGAAAAVHPASAQQPTSTLAVNVYLVMPTDIWFRGYRL